MFALVVCTLVWNMRFIQAYVEMKSSFRAFIRHDPEKAIELMNSASKHVPENSELRGMVVFYQGVLFLQQDKSAEALAAFNSCRSLLQGKIDKTLDRFTLSAAISVAFDSKDYDRFLALSIKNYNENPDDAHTCAQVASAYACKFAVTGDEQFREKSLKTLETARTLSRTDPSFKEYEQRILHRLYSREIIKRKEFLKRFPNGWKEPQKE
jgi:hypothetical protein